MYAIAQIIYGVPLVDAKNNHKPSRDLEAAISNGDYGAMSFYSGNADEQPAAFGIELGGFDEACAYIDIDTLPLTPTTKQLAEYQALWSALPIKLQKEISENYGEPRAHILWSTS